MPRKLQYPGPRPVHCPHCGHKKIVGHGKPQGGRRRWRCRGCEASFHVEVADSSNPSTLGQYLCQLRRQARLRTVDVGELLNISSAHVSLVERAKRRPSPRLLETWVETLGGNLETATGLSDEIRR